MKICLLASNDWLLMLFQRLPLILNMEWQTAKSPKGIFFTTWYLLCFIIQNIFFITFCILFSFQHRDALLTTYPSVKHLMCYFHIVKNCKDHLKSFPKEVQKTILCDIQFLHLSTSEEDFSVREVTILRKWYELAPDFVRYFNCQWNADNSFSNWKIFCSKPGKSI